MKLLLMISLLTGVPDDFELPPDIVMYARSSSQVLIGVWGSEDASTEGTDDDRTSTGPGVMADAPASEDEILQTGAPVEEGAGVFVPDPARLFRPVPMDSAAAAGPVLWSNEAPGDSTLQTLYLWWEDGLLDLFLEQYREETIYLEVEDSVSPDTVAEDTVRVIRVLDIRAGDVRYRDWKEALELMGIGLGSPSERTRRIS